MADENRITTEQVEQALYALGERASYTRCDGSPECEGCPSCEADDAQDILEAFIAQFPRLYPEPKESP